MFGLAGFRLKLPMGTRRQNEENVFCRFSLRDIREARAMRRAYLLVVAAVIVFAIFAPRSWLPRQPGRLTANDVVPVTSRSMDPLSAIIVRGVLIMGALWSLQARDNMRQGEI